MNMLGLTNLFGFVLETPDWIAENTQFSWVGGLIDGFNYAIFPILLIAGAAGILYSILLGVNLARAETSEKREEAKKRLIWCIIGIVSIFVLMLVMILVINNMHNILGVDPNPGT